MDISFTMTKGMEGPHHFLIVLQTNDPRNRTVELSIKADFSVN
ncbi:MAG: hypothetical protein AABZ64_13770 [Nitrospinota bacterium]